MEITRVITSDGPMQSQWNWRCQGLPQETPSLDLHNYECFSDNIFTGTAKKKLKRQLKIIPADTCLDNTSGAGMAAENIFQLSCSY